MNMNERCSAERDLIGGLIMLTWGDCDEPCGPIPKSLSDQEREDILREVFMTADSHSFICPQKRVIFYAMECLYFDKRQRKLDPCSIFLKLDELDLVDEAGGTVHVFAELTRKTSSNFLPKMILSNARKIIPACYVEPRPVYAKECALV